MMIKTKSYSCVASGLLVRELLVRDASVSHLTRQIVNNDTPQVLASYYSILSNNIQVT